MVRQGLTGSNGAMIPETQDVAKVEVLGNRAIGRLGLVRQDSKLSIVPSNEFGQDGVGLLQRTDVTQA